MTAGGRAWPHAHGHELGARHERKRAALGRRGIALLRVGGDELAARPLEVVARIVVAHARAA